MVRLPATSTALFSGTSTQTTTNIFIQGVIGISAAGTVIPQITYSVAPGGIVGANTIEPGSFVRIRRIGSSATGNISIGNWA
jgi:hypothetical protein